MSRPVPAAQPDDEDTPFWLSPWPFLEPPPLPPADDETD
jgi:hypothetical protein